MAITRAFHHGNQQGISPWQSAGLAPWHGASSELGAHRLAGLPLLELDRREVALRSRILEWLLEGLPGHPGGDGGVGHVGQARGSPEGGHGALQVSCRSESSNKSLIILVQFARCIV